MDQLPLPGSGPKDAIAAPFSVAMDHTASMSTLPPGTVLDQPFPAVEPRRMYSYYRGSDTIKAKIMSQPLYPALLRAYIDCRKVGAPPEVVGRLSSLADELVPNSDETQEQPADPELDQFMETYRDVLVAYSQELTRQIQEANEFFRSMEAHIDSFALDDNGCDLSPEDEQETGTGDVASVPLPITSPSGEGKELTNQLLDKYSGYLRSLWRELSGRKKNGRLPRYARQKLLRWWQLHHRWPYPSELEKHALGESTGLDAKQINNWFINQRKRHWNPAPLTMGVDNSYQHISGASSSSPADLRMEERCFTATEPSGYPDGGPSRP